jgi:nucleoside-diphosphate-sugar epimerase
LKTGGNVNSLLPNSGRRYIIVGGAGFIGSHFTDALPSDPTVTTVILYDNFSSGSEWHYERYTGDIYFPYPYEVGRTAPGRGSQEGWLMLTFMRAQLSQAAALLSARKEPPNLISSNSG